MISTRRGTRLEFSQYSHAHILYSSFGPTLKYNLAADQASGYVVPPFYTPSDSVAHPRVSELLLVLMSRGDGVT